MYSLINNLDNKVIANLKNDSELIDKVSKIVIENEDFDFSVLGISDAKEYIEDYCDNLDLLVDSEGNECGSKRTISLKNWAFDPNK